jgi:hypothetical protein
MRLSINLQIFFQLLTMFEILQLCYGYIITLRSLIFPSEQSLESYSSINKLVCPINHISNQNLVIINFGPNPYKYTKHIENILRVYIKNT